MTTTDPSLYKLVSVTSVEVLHDYVVRLSFSDGCVGELDLEPKLRGPIFDPLRADYDLFRQVHIPPGEGTIVWPNGADMAPEVLHVEADTNCPDPWDHPIPHIALTLDPEEAELVEHLLDRELARLEAEGKDPDVDDDAALVDMVREDLARRRAELGADGLVVPIDKDTGDSMDEWLASLPRDEPPIELPVSAAELVREARRDEE